MLKRQLLFIVLIALPTAIFLILHRRPILLVTLPPTVVAGWWAASPLTWPRWISHGLVRALPIAGLQTLALWTWTS